MNMQFYDFSTEANALAWKANKERLGWQVSAPGFCQTRKLWFVVTNFGATAN